MSLSLRARLLAGLGAVAVILVVVAYTAITTTRGHLIDQVDHQLVAAADSDRDDHFDRPGDGYRPPPSRPEGAPPERLSDMFEGVLYSDGTLDVYFASNLPGEEYSEPDLDPDAVAPPGETFTAGSVEGDVRYRVLTTDYENGLFVYALPLNDVDDTVNRMITFQVLALAAVLAGLAAVAWWVIHLGIRPIKDMTSTAGEIAGGDLSARIPDPDSMGTEAAELARALNLMLGRIEESVDEQTRSEQRLRQFVADASHELRTPVTTIQGYAELYRHGGLRETGDLDDAMRRTEQEAGRMGRLVDDMLTLAKLDQERPLHVASIDLSRLVEDAALDARATAPDHPVNAAVAPGLTLEGDEDRLRQVMANVVGNAIVHTPAGTPVTLAARAGENRGEGEDDAVVIEVSDEGPGMDPEHAARVTERFYRADRSRSRERGGSGLGMAIVESVVGAHGGSVSVDSVPGRGTTIRIRLPLRPDPQPEDRPHSEISAEPQPDPSVASEPVGRPRPDPQGP